MSLTILNNISSLSAENALSNTQANLQKTLTQLSTGMKINSGSDDAAGLSFATGMQANVAALTQSQQNASNGIGMLQTADGALSQVTTLLNRAVTLATEGATSGVTTSQASALNNEFQSILSEVNQIGQTTNFNGQNVFTSNAPTASQSSQGSVTNPLATTTTLNAGSVTTITDSSTGGTFSYTATATGHSGTSVSQISDLNTAIGNAVSAGTLSAGTKATINAYGKLQIATTTAGASQTVSSNDAALGTMSSTAASVPVVSSQGSTAAPLTAGTKLAAGSVTTIKDAATGATFTFTADSGATASTVNDLIAAFTTAAAATVNGAGQTNDNLTGGGAGVLTGNFAPGAAMAIATVGSPIAGATTGQLAITNSKDNGLTATTNDAALGSLNSSATNSNTATVYIGDGVTTGTANTQISTTINALSSTSLNLNTNDLSSSASSTAALLAVTAAITTVSAQRGVIGASVNRLTAASSNMSNAVTNLTSATDSIQNADIGKTVANMTQYNVLQSTGMAALQQSNQAQQAVLKLVQ
jgi:flagellin